MNVRITAHQSYMDHFNVKKDFDDAKNKLSDAIKEIYQYAIITDSLCLTKSSNFKVCGPIRYMVTITFDETPDSHEETMEIIEDLKHVLKIYGWTVF